MKFGGAKGELSVCCGICVVEQGWGCESQVVSGSQREALWSCLVWWSFWSLGRWSFSRSTGFVMMCDAARLSVEGKVVFWTALAR